MSYFSRLVFFSLCLILPIQASSTELPRNKKTRIDQMDTIKRTVGGSFALGFLFNYNNSNSALPLLAGAVTTASADVAYSKMSGDKNYLLQAASCALGYLSGLVAAQTLKGFVSSINPQGPSHK